MKMSPQDEALLAQIMFGGGMGQLQAARPGPGMLYPAPNALPPQPMVAPGQSLDQPLPGGLSPANLGGVNVKGGVPYGGMDTPLARAAFPPQAAPMPQMREPVNPAPMARSAPAPAPVAPSAPMDVAETGSTAPMPSGVSPAQPAGPQSALAGLFADKPEIMARLGDMMAGWAMGSGGTWQDSLAAGAKAMQIGKVTRREEQKAAKSFNATAELARKKGVDEATIAAFGDDGRGLLAYTIDASKGDSGLKIETIFDPQTGREMKVAMNPNDPTQYVPIGGVKAPAKPLVENNINTGDKGTDAALKGFGEQQGAMMAAGSDVPMNMARIDRLEAVLNGAPQGMEGGIKQIAGEFGINTDGLDNIQSAQAILNSMVPSQRLPGSGPMSDADLKLFKESIPRIINQPGGNAIIIDTLRSLEQYKAAYADIAAKYATGQLTAPQVLEAQKVIPNPMAKLTAAMNQGNTSKSDLYKKYGLE